MEKIKEYLKLNCDNATCQNLYMRAIHGSKSIALNILFSKIRNF